jgi:hypothetical protein
MTSSSPSRTRNWTLLLLSASLVLAVAAWAVGIDDNLPGILLALLAAFTFVLAFVHPWRTARKYLILLLVSFIVLLLFFALTIVLDINAVKPDAPSAIQALVQSPVFEAVSMVLYFLLPVTILTSIFGALTMFLRRRS